MSYTIVSAYQSGSSVKVECKSSSNGGKSFTVPGQLVSFSENMVAVKDGNYVKTYDADHHQTSSHYSK